MKINTTNVVYSSYPNNEWIVSFEDGANAGEGSNLKTIEQAIHFALETGRFKYPIMGANYGITLDDLVGTDYSYIKSEVARRIRDALSTDDRIIEVNDFKYETVDGSSMKVECTVKTILGNVNVTTTVQG